MSSGRKDLGFTEDIGEYRGVVRVAKHDDVRVLGQVDVGHKVILGAAGHVGNAWSGFRV